VAEIPEHEGRVSDWASEDGPPPRTSRSGSNIRPQALSTAPGPQRALRFVITTTVVVAGMGSAAGDRGPPHDERLVAAAAVRSSGFATGPHSGYRD